MRYDFPRIHQLCRELGIRSCIRSDELLEVELRKGVVLCFLNAERDEDCLVGFKETLWHTHDQFIFCDGRGFFTEMNYLDVITGLKTGQILVCEQWQTGKIMDRSLVHCEFNDHLKHLAMGEEIRIIRPVVPLPFSE